MYMKKFFTLTMLLLCAVVGAKATTYKITFNGKNVGDTDYFSWNSSKHNFNTKFNGCTYDGVTYTSGLKMEGATQVSWTSTATATVTIVQSTWSDKTIKLDGTALSVSDASTSITGCRVYTIANVAAGSHSMTRGSGESGVFAIYVEYTGSVMTQLSSPEISFTATTGEVTIGSVTNASKITYTTDGTDPTDESTEYSAAFTVEDGTTVKAIAIGDGESYLTSDVSTKVVYLSGITVATPVITAINGTVNISCSTIGATVKYSTDGTNYSDFTLPLTYFANKTVYAKAVRAGATDSEVATQAVEAAPAAATGSQTKILGFVTPGDNNWEYMNANSTNYGIQGKTGTDEEGWSLWISPNSSDAYDKAISGDGSANSTYTINSTSYQYIKNSNGRQFNIGIPSGYKANRLTIYSFNNGTATSTSLWSNVAGTTYTAETEIPLVSNAGNAPEIRVFQLDDVTDNIVLNNNGAIQQCFILVVDYTTSKCTKPTINVTDFTFADKGYPVTITGSDNLWVSTDGENYTQQTSPYNTVVTSTTTFYAKSTAEGKDDSEVAEQAVTYSYDNSKKFIAWVYTKGYGSASYAFATDPMVIELQKTYNVVEVNYSADTTPSTDLNNADLIVCTEAMTGNKTMSNGMKAFAGVTPMIGLKAFNYTKGRWSWGKPANPNPSAQAFTPKAIYKVLNGVNYESDGTIKLATASSGNVIQTVEFGTEGTTAPEGNTILGTLGDSDTQAVMYTSSKYFGLGLSSDCWDTYTTNAVTIVKNAAAMLIAGEALDTEVPTISKHISAAGYATLCSEHPLVFVCSGLKAYIATVDSKTVTFTEVTSVPANTGVLLKGTEGDKTIAVAASSTDVSANQLVGVLTDTPVAAGIFVLMNGENGVGFYKTTNTFTVGANTAYLPASVAEGRAFIGFADEPEATGINEVKTMKASNDIYNLKGQRVEKAKKGLYIIGGKKVVMK